MTKNCKITFVCVYCKKEKTVYKNPHQSYKYCSHNCRYADKFSRTVITCKFCGKQKEVLNSYVNRGQYKFCNRECYTLSRGNINNHRRGYSFKRQKILAMERDLGVCRLCNSNKADAVHHIIPFRYFGSGKEANKLSNLISLCNKCHYMTYNKELEFADLFYRILKGDENGEG